MPPAPCIPVFSLPGAHATLPRQPILPPLPPSCSRPPAAALRRLPHAPPPPPRLCLGAPAVALQSLPTLAGSLSPSPARRCAPQTRSGPRSATAQGLRSDTAVPHSPRSSHPAQTAPPSTPPASRIPAPLPLPQCTTHLLLPPAPALPARPICRSACSLSAHRSAPCAPPPPRLLHATLRTWSSPSGHRHVASVPAAPRSILALPIAVSPSLPQTADSAARPFPQPLPALL